MLTFDLGACGWPRSPVLNGFNLGFLGAEKPLRFVPEWVGILFLNQEKSTVLVWRHQDGPTSKHTKNRHPVVCSLVDNKVFNFDAT